MNHKCEFCSSRNMERDDNNMIYCLDCGNLSSDQPEFVDSEDIDPMELAVEQMREEQNYERANL